MRVPAGVEKLGVLASARNWAFDEMKGVGSVNGATEALSPLIGKDAPDFELSMLDGSKFKLSEHLGKEVLVLDFWATWCGPCLRAMPEIMSAVEEFKGEPVRLVGVNQQEAAGKVKRFLRSRGWDLAVAMDEQLAVREKYAVRGIPTTVIIGKDGKVAMVHVGFSPGIREELVADIKRALE